MQAADDSMDVDDGCEEYYDTTQFPTDDAAAALTIQLNNSFDASMLNKPESEQKTPMIRQVASWDASRTSQQELPSSYSAKKLASRRPPTTVINTKLTPASVKRQRTVQRKSPRHRSDTLFSDQDQCEEDLIVPKKRAPKDSLGTHTTAASSTLLDETLDSADDSSLATGAASAGAPFRFTSFPASLPRLSQPSNEQSARKRMSFGGLSFLNQQPQHLSSSAADEFTNNTSLSSVGYESDHSNQHERLGEEEDSNSSSLLGTPVLRTRLNFNALLSPQFAQGNVAAKGQHQQLLMKESRHCKDPLPPLMDGSDKQYESNRASIFARTFPFLASASSNPNERQLTAEEQVCNFSSAKTPSRVSSDSHFRLESRQPGTLRDVQLHFQLDAAQCSPIPGIPEEDGDLSRSRNDTSHESSSTWKKSARPMPDMHAFDTDANASRDHSTDGTLSSNNSRSKQPTLLCPPTPVRTPAWAQEDATARPVIKNGGHIKFGRTNSLVTTKVLAMCEPQVLIGRASLENSSTVMDGQRRDILAPPIEPTHSEDSETKTIEGDKDCSMEYDENEWLHDGSLHETRLSIGSPPVVQQTKRRSVFPPENLPPVVSLATHFDVQSTLGSGAFADVYRVRSKVDGCLYAVKRNRRHFRGRRDRERALAEVKWMQRLQTPGLREDASNIDFSQYILFFFQAWQEDCHFYVQTELCCRDTLADITNSLRSQWTLAESRYPSLRRLAPPSSTSGMSHDFELSDLDGRLFPESTIWKICHDVGAGLSHIHSHSLVHFDIKPSNIFLLAHGRLGAIAKIGDFGMAGDIGSSEDGQEGDQKYMAGEVLVSDRKHPSADIFSLGVMIYELSAFPSFILPDEGSRWRDLRSGTLNPGDIPSCRSKDLKMLLKSTLQSNKDDRPSADSMLALEPVSAAGSSCDYFLRDYIYDIEEFDRQEEERFFYRQEDKTPRTQKPQFRACSPSLNFVRDNLITSPEAAAQT
ncbi:hypothetical protein MPSEU_000103300 [Mayamaea pseudoterrestris]|nr:hypothetical protein MPSEU_000103300 [Mayamaea pseudoterrestris]